MPPTDKQLPTSSGSSTEGVTEEQRSNVSTAPMSTKDKLWVYLTGNVRPTILAEIQLLILTFCIGLQDAVSFPDFHCFASNQTGNTVFLILALVFPNLDGDIFETPNIGVALGFFLLSAYITGQLGHLVGPRRRAWLIFSNLVQTGLVFAAAGVQYSQLDENNELPVKGTRTLLAIGFLASAAGSQVVLSRSLRLQEITTAMATAAWLDLVIDPKLFKLHNRPRNRRAGFLIIFILGILAGAYIFKRHSSPAALVVSGSGKALVTLMFFFNSAEKPKSGDEEGWLDRPLG